MNTLKIISTITFSAFILSACGGGKNTPKGGGSTGGENPEGRIENTCSDTLSANGKTATYKSGSEGDINFNCKFPSKNNLTGQEYNLKNAMASLNIKNVQRTTDLDYSCNNGMSFKGTSVANYKTGIVNYSGVRNGSSVSCTETYNPAVAFPTTISGHDSIENLLENDFDGNDPAQTTCPKDIDDTNFGTPVCTGFFNTQYNVTDESNKVHKVSVNISFR